MFNCVSKTRYTKRGIRGILLVFLLMALPGWASYVNYLADWSGEEKYQLSQIKIAYLALRISLLYLICPSKVEVLQIYSQYKWCLKSKRYERIINEIKNNESTYQQQLTTMLLSAQASDADQQNKPQAQFVFCIDSAQNLCVGQ